MAAEIYGQMLASLNGALATEATTVSTALENTDQDVLTLAKGWAGQTPSPQKRVTKITAMVPIAGFEFDYEQKELDKEVVVLGLQLLGSGKKCEAEGFLRNVSIEAGVGQNLSVSFEHHGTASAFA